MNNIIKYYIFTFIQAFFYVTAGEFIMLQKSTLAILLLVCGAIIGYIQTRQVTYAGYAVAQFEKEEYIEEIRKVRRALYYPVQSSEKSDELNELLSDITSSQSLNHKIQSVQKFNQDDIATIVLKDGGQILVLANKIREM